jgi:hypothetical protein
VRTVPRCAARGLAGAVRPGTGEGPLDLGGPEPLSRIGVAATYGEVLGRRVRAVSRPAAAFAVLQLAGGPARAGDPSADQVMRGLSGSSMSGLSSSSTLTSLNVSTRTLRTNRAGRYMSQTQASESFSSK